MNVAFEVKFKLSVTEEPISEDSDISTIPPRKFYRGETVRNWPQFWNSVAFELPYLNRRSFEMAEHIFFNCIILSVVYLGDYDIFIVTSEADQDNANKLTDVLVKFCKVCCAYDLTVYPESEIWKNKLEHLDSGLAHSTYGFIFVDNGFQLDELVMFGTNTGLIEMINRQDRSIIPVKAHQAIVIPSLLRTFRFLDVHKLLKGKRLEDIDVNSLTETDIDKALLSLIHI